MPLLIEKVMVSPTLVAPSGRGTMAIGGRNADGAPPLPVFCRLGSSCLAKWGWVGGGGDTADRSHIVELWQTNPGRISLNRAFDFLMCCKRF